MTVHCPFVQVLAVSFGFKGARSTVVAFDINIEHVVKLVKNCSKLNGDIRRPGLNIMQQLHTELLILEALVP